LYCGVEFAPVSARARVRIAAQGVVAIKSSSGRSLLALQHALTSAAKALSGERGKTLLHGAPDAKNRFQNALSSGLVANDNWNH
jgi:hypothetical protein